MVFVCQNRILAEVQDFSQNYLIFFDKLFLSPQKYHNATEPFFFNFCMNTGNFRDGESPPGAKSNFIRLLPQGEIPCYAKIENRC